MSKCVASLNAVIKFIREKDNYNIGLVGSSFGGLVSFVVASQDPKIKALALKSSVTEPIKFWQQRLGPKRIQKWKKKGIMHYNEIRRKL